MKKVLYIITHSHWGGAQRYVFDMASALKAAGGEPVVAFGESGELEERLALAGVKTIRLKNMKRSNNPLINLLAVFEVKKIVNQEKPDVVHVNSSNAAIAGSIGAKLAAKRPKVIFTAHGLVFTPGNPISIFKKKLYVLIHKLAAFFQDKIICVSDFDRDVALKNKICAAKKITVIHNGAADEEFLTKPEALAKLGLRESDFVIGSIGRLSVPKNYETLIEAIKILSDLNKIAGLKLIIIGEGPERKKLEDIIAKNRLANLVFLPGAMPDASKILKGLDLFVLSSRFEAFPYVVLEAMLSEISIVATNVGGISEAINDGENGLLIEPKNPKYWINMAKLYKLVDKKEKAKEAAIKASELEPNLKAAAEQFVAGLE